MHSLPGRVRVVAVLAVLLMTLLAAGAPATLASDPVIAVPTFYLPLVARNNPPVLPPPLEAAMTGWLRKWRESSTLPRCLQVAGTPYYLEEEPNKPWLAAIVATDVVAEDSLELLIDNRVFVRGVAEYFDAECPFPRLEVREVRIASQQSSCPECIDAPRER